MNTMIVLRVCSFAAAIGVCACGGSEAPKTPLGGASSSGGSTEVAAAPAITGEARVALDSGNALFRAKAYDMALAQYRRSAQLAPGELTPLLGIMMVADVTRDSKLAEVTLPKIRKLNPVFADSSAMMSHSKIIRAHPRTAPVTPPARKPANRTSSELD